MPELPNAYKVLFLALAAPGLYCLMLLLGRRLKRQRGVKLGVLYHLFSACLAVYVPAMLFSLDWEFRRHLGAAVVILGATVLIALVDRYLWDLYFRVQHGVSVPKFLTELVRLMILAVAVFLVLDIGYGQTLKGLLVGPGIAAVVVGLAMQDLVSNIIAGISLQAGKSYSQGDWLILDGRHAEVVEINWRATRLRTLDHILMEVPNREMSRLTLINLNKPHRLHAMRVAVTLDYAVPPTRAKNVLLHAVANTQGIAPDPKPKVFLKEFGDSGVEYEIKFWMDDHGMYNEVCDAIRSNVWYSFRRHGIRIPYPTRTVQLERAVHDKQQEVQSAARAILRQQPLFRCLSDEQLDALLPRGRVVHFGQGETLMQQGDEGESMFILVEGQASVTVQKNGTSQPVAMLRSGDCVGEMSLLTGERRTATVIARTDCEAVEIGKAVLARSLRENPKLLEQLSELLARRRMENEGTLTTGALRDGERAMRTQYAAGFVSKLRTFFEL